MRIAKSLALVTILGLTVACVQPAAVATPAAVTTPSPESSPYVAETPSPEPSPLSDTFVVPAQPAEQPSAWKALPNGSFTHPAVEAELRTVFDLFYKARMLPRGGRFDVDGLRGLVVGAYADYTLPLFEQEISDARAGKLLEVGFSGITVSLTSWIPWGTDALHGQAQVSVTRTRTEIRAAAAPTQETATYVFNLERQLVGTDGVAWTVSDFVNPATGRWISQPPPVTAIQAAEELKAYFAAFYSARSVVPGEPFDPFNKGWFAAGSYEAYTTPLLKETQREVASGAVKEIRYADISVRVLSWDERATEHGGLATVEVTRTAYVTRASGPEAPQTATYQFRVHRHEGPMWVTVDFFRPDVSRWVTDLAGATVIVPEVGHG
jgi:hypothetical protein